MRKERLEQMTKGWFVGNFTPTALSTDAAEVAVKSYIAGQHEGRHYHRLATEITLILSGRARMSGEELVSGDIVHVEPGEAVDFEALTDVVTVVVKVPSIAGDKYEC